MSVKVTTSNMASEIARQFGVYSEEIANEVKRVTDDVAYEAMKEIKQHITFNDKKYSKAMAIKTTEENEYGKTDLWYVKKPYYRLTHLLEKGHATRNGGRTKAYPHIKYGDDFIQNEYPKRIEEVLKNVK